MTKAVSDIAARQFPILQAGRGPREFVPWDFVDRRSIRKQAEKNCAGQTLERIAERGGLSWRELLAALFGYHPTEVAKDYDHRGHILKMVSAWETTL